MIRRFKPIAMLILGLAASLALAQTHVVLDLSGRDAEKYKIAVPDFALHEPSGVFDQAWATVQDVLKADLRNSGFCEILDPSRIRLIKSPHVGVIDFDEWGSIEAQYLVVGAIRNREGSMYVEVRVYEVATRQHIIAKAYRSKPHLARKTAHVIADEIMVHLRNVRFATSKIVFNHESIGASESRMRNELFIMDYDGEGMMPITEGGLALSPSAVNLNQNTLLAYCVYEKPFTFNASYGLYFKKSLVSQPQVLFRDSERRAAAPALSPDGRKVAFSVVERGNVDVFVMNIDGSDLLRLTRHPGVDTNPCWAPGGASLLFTSDRTGSPQIYMTDADGLNKRRITFENPYNDSADWNPHYDYISYVSRFDNDFDIFVMDLKTGKNYRLTYREGSNEDPCWAPDGEHIVFSSNRSGTWQVYVVRSNGDNLMQITRSGHNRNPVWVR